MIVTTLRTNGIRTNVSVQYKVLADHRVSFQIGAYDRSRELIIDPKLVFPLILAAGQNASSAVVLMFDAQRYRWWYERLHFGSPVYLALEEEYQWTESDAGVFAYRPRVRQ